MQAAITLQEPLVEKYLDSVSLMSKSSSDTYRFRLYPFIAYTKSKHGSGIEELIQSIRKRKVDVYDLLADYASYLQKMANKNDGRGQATLKRRVNVVKLLLIYHDVEISELKFKTKVKLPKSIRRDKEPIDKEDVRKILLACEDPRVKTYVMLLASTGMRAREALSLRFANFDLISDPPRINIPGEFTKTRTDRYVYLTREFVKQFEDYKVWRHRERRISFYVDENGSKRHAETIFKPEYRSNDLVFAVPHRDRAIDAAPESLYREMLTRMNAIVDRIGLGALENHSKFRKITRHSFRRFAFSTISDLGYANYADWFVGHSGSTYYRKKEAEKAAIFKKIEDYLVFLDLTSLEKTGKDLQTRVDELQNENRDLRKDLDKVIEKKVQEILGRVDLTRLK